MQTKISVAVGNTRKSVLTDNPSISANGSHVVIDVEGEQGDLVSLLMDRDCVLRILEDGYRAGMFDRLLYGPCNPAAEPGSRDLGMSVPDDGGSGILRATLAAEAPDAAE